MTQETQTKIEKGAVIASVIVSGVQLALQVTGLFRGKA
jgi:hypothetical protein